MKFLLTFLFIIILSMGGCSPPTKPMPKAVKGVLDLRDWDFDPLSSPR
jgi:hypothetical protein